MKPYPLDTTSDQPAQMTNVKASADCLQRVVSGIIIPQHPPPGIVEALRHFVEAIEGYGETGVWPDNYTLRALADEGRAALNCGHSANEKS